MLHHTNQARTEICRVRWWVYRLGEGLGGYEGLVQHINQSQRCVCVPALSLALGLGWAWPGEGGALSRIHPQLMIGPTVLSINHSDP